VGAAIIATLGVGAAAMIIGMKAIDAGLQKIAETAVKMTELLGGLNLGQVAQTVGIMAVMSVAFVAVGALVLAAGVIGAGILASLGLGAKAIEKGMETITNAVGILSGTVIGIMQQLNEMNVDPAELKGKAEAFGAVLSGVSGLMASVAIILSDMPFSMFDDPEQTRTKMEGVQKFMTDLIGVKGGGGGVIGIIETITQSLQSLPPDKIESAKALGGVLSAVGNLVGSLAGPVIEIIKQSSEGWFTTAAQEAEKTSKAMTELKDFMTTVMKSGGELVKTIADSLKELKPEQAAALEKGGGAIAGIIGAIAKFMEIAKPPKIEIKNVNFKGFGDSINVAGPNIGEMLKAMKDNIPGIIDSLIESVQKMPADKGFLDKVNTLKTVFDFLSKMTEMMKTMKEFKPVKVDTTLLDAMLEPIETMASFFFALGLGGILFALVKGINSAAKPLQDPESKGIGAKAKLLTDLLSGVTGMMKELNDINKGGENFKPEKMTEALDNVSKALSASSPKIVSLVGTLSGITIDATQAKAAETNTKTIGALGKSITTISGAIGELSTAATSINSNLTALNALAGTAVDGSDGNLAKVGAASKKVMDVFSNFKIGATTQATAVVKAVQDMVKAVQDMDTALSKVPPIDISTRLTKFAGQMGVGSQGIYTVKSKEVIVTVNLKVTMDAGTLEKTIVENSKSIIRDRINFLLDDKGIESTNKTTAKISENYGQSRAPTLTP